MENAKKKSVKTDKPGVPKTVTCAHCRYERPAGDEYCPICGFPWPWNKKP
jgi:hypothetical protein